MVPALGSGADPGTCRDVRGFDGDAHRPSTGEAVWCTPTQTCRRGHVELALSADWRVAPIPKRVGDTKSLHAPQCDPNRIDPLGPIRKLFSARWTFDIHSRHDAGELHKIEGVPQ